MEKLRIKRPRGFSAIGEKYGRLTIMSELCDNGITRYECLCDCGKTKSILKQSVLNGKTKSCGCIRSETSGKNFKSIGTHRMTKTGTWATWKSMKARCTNPNLPEYKNYGGRGITVCNDWMDSFDAFYRDMGNKPKGLSLDRIDNSGNYCKGNCRWATWGQQSNNKRTNVVVTYKGETKTATEFAKELGIPNETFTRRLRNSSISFDDCFSPFNLRDKTAFV